MKKALFFAIGCCISIVAKPQSTASGNFNKTDNKDINSALMTDSEILKDYSEVDAYALSLKIRYSDLEELANDLTKNYKNEEDKVRAIYRWITENISYDCKDYHRGVPTSQRVRAKHKRDAGDFRYYFALSVLRSKKGVCDGYATLFYELCKASGIACTIAEGTTDSNPKWISYYRKHYFYYPDHAWNKVRINKKWFYVDATWSSGSCNSRVTKFYKDFNNAYYLTPLNNLYTTHVENKY